MLAQGNVFSCNTPSYFKRISEKASKTDQLVVVDFTRAGIGPCRYIDCFVDKVAEKMPHIIFLKVDVDELEQVATKFKVEGIPTFVLLKRGKEIERILGPTKGELVGKIVEIDMMQQNDEFEQNLVPTKEEVGDRVTVLQLLRPIELLSWYVKYSKLDPTAFGLQQKDGRRKVIIGMAIFFLILGIVIGVVVF